MLTTPALGALTIGPGLFANAQKTNRAYVHALDVERLLAPFRREAGLPSSAPSYGNWESQGLDGHTLGHYLSAISVYVAVAKDPSARRQLTRALAEIARCQNKIGTGYVAGIPGGEHLWDSLSRGKFSAETFSTAERWVPLYNLHKLFAGLIDAHRYAGAPDALRIVTWLAEWWLGVAEGINDSDFENMLEIEYGGLNESFALLGQLTGRHEFSLMARRLSHRRFLESLELDADQLAGMHANTQIAKVIGYQTLGQLEGDARLTRAARRFFDIVVRTHTVAIGGNSVREHFCEANDFRSHVLEREGPESCNTYNMIRLAHLLYQDTGNDDYLEFIERALFNHVLSAQHPTRGGFVYFTPVRPAHYRVYSSSDTGFWCCVGTGMEANARHATLAFSLSALGEIGVDQFISARFDWAERDFSIEQITGFPFERMTRIRIHTQQPQRVPVAIRIPAWVDGSAEISLNGQCIQVAPAGTRARLDRLWSPGDEIQVDLPMSFGLREVPENSDWVSAEIGPIVLAARDGTELLDGLYAGDGRMSHVAHGALKPLAEAPLLHLRRDGTAELTTIDPNLLHFSMRGIDGFTVELEPFFGIHNTRYTLYWPIEKDGAATSGLDRLINIDAQALELDRKTIDAVIFGEQQSETEHQLTGTALRTGNTNAISWRSTLEQMGVRLEGDHSSARLRLG
ncbi:MAG: beta-L-arabinofuranosidase domain-containing protein, partial [Lacisediminihabitans sp.]